MTDLVIQKVENDSSIAINRNSKGYTWGVKAYGRTEVEIQDKLRNLISTATGVVKELETVLLVK